MMTKLELYEKEKLIVEQYQQQLHNLRMEYVQDNKEYNIGDYIQSLSGNGIIKIDEIKYNDNMGMISVMYCGHGYHYIQGRLVRSENDKIICLSHNLELIK